MWYFIGRDDMVSGWGGLQVGRRMAAAALLHSLEVVQAGMECEGGAASSTRFGSLAKGPS